MQFSITELKQLNCPGGASCISALSAVVGLELTLSLHVQLFLALTGGVGLSQVVTVCPGA